MSLLQSTACIGTQCSVFLDTLGIKISSGDEIELHFLIIGKNFDFVLREMESFMIATAYFSNYCDKSINYYIGLAFVD